jgi:hypothetical protein
MDASVAILRREEELRKYFDALSNWEKTCAGIEAEREEAVRAMIAEERAELIEAAAKKRDAMIAEADSVIKSQEKRKAEAASAISALSVFSTGARKQQKAVIEEATRLEAEAKDKIVIAKTEFSAEMEDVEKRAERRIEEFRARAEKEFPLPAEPSKPA